MLSQSETVYDEKYLKTYGDKINTNFHDNGMSKDGCHYVCLSTILIGSAFNMGKNHYPKVFLVECKYIVKEKKMSKFIKDDWEISSNEPYYSDKTDEKSARL